MSNRRPLARKLVSVDSVSVEKNRTRILDNISMELHEGEIITLIGPNGAGKSTLVKVILGLDKPTSGTVWRDAAIRMAYVPQNLQLDATLPLSVRRFLELARASGRHKPEAALRQVDARHVADYPLAHISGGELRRVLLARALLTQPNLLILDEPTAGVDINGQAALYALIQEISGAISCGVILVSHDLHIVMAATDHVLCLNRHLCCSGNPEDVQTHPEFVSLFGQAGAASLGIYRHYHEREQAADHATAGSHSYR